METMMPRSAVVFALSGVMEGGPEGLRWLSWSLEDPIVAGIQAAAAGA